MLLLDDMYDPPLSLETRDQILSQLLPRFERLSYVELQNCWDRFNRAVLLRAILAHPNVISVLVHDLPHESMHDLDLSKVILDHRTSLSSVFDPEFKKCLNHGMRVMELQLDNPKILASAKFKLRTFPQLTTIKIVGFIPASFSWLPNLSLNHPTLNELWLHDFHQRHLDRRTPPFISSFVETSQQMNLTQSFKIKKIGLRRTIPLSSRRWYVMGLTLSVFNTSLIEILTLVASSFPKLEALTLGPDCSYGPKATYRFSDVATVLGQFSCLRTLSLVEPSRILNFRSDEFFPLVRPVEPANTIDVLYARVETGTLWYASRLARDVRSLDTIHFDDMGYTHDTQDHWALRGWLHVLNGDREVRGTVERDTFLSRKISLETRMLPPSLLALEVF
ncbi:hypothetical protein EV361DRAFT_951361 [Lentinula raphanica]|nr:hypothetical protein EV361DRAFT_951361 [Lentinula raphanica]